MVYRDRVCIPLQAQYGLIRAHHDTMAHVGYEKLWRHMEVRFEWADREYAQKIRKASSDHV